METVAATYQREAPKKTVFDVPFFDFEYETEPTSAVDGEEAEEPAARAVSKKPEPAQTAAVPKPAPNPKPAADSKSGADAKAVVETKPLSATNPTAKTLAKTKQKWTLVLGSFTDYRRAVELALKVKPEAGLLTTIVVDGKIHYRVSTPALKRDQAEGRKSNIADLKIKNVKLMPVCPPWEQKDGCVALDRQIAIRKTD